MIILKKINFVISLLFVIVWMVVIFIFSEMPSDESNMNSKKIVNKIIQGTIETSAQDNKSEKKANITIKKQNEVVNNYNIIFRKIAHASVYFVLCLFVINLILQIKKKLKLNLIIIAVLFCFIYACTDEYHQLFVEGRSGQFLDVAIDTGGAVFGSIMFYFAYKLYKKKIAKST